MATANLLRIKEVKYKQTVNRNRFSLRFSGVNAILDRAKNHRLESVRRLYYATRNAITRPGNLNLIDSNILELSLASANLPNVVIETQDIFRFNDSYKTTTRFAPMEDFTCNFYDYIEGSASAFLYLWKSLIADKQTGAFGFKQEYILPEAFYIVYGPDAPGYEVNADGNFDLGNGVTAPEIPWIQVHKLENLYPKTVNLGESSYESAEARKVECAFNIDKTYPVDFQSFKINENGQYQYSNLDAFSIALGGASNNLYGDLEKGPELPTT